MDILHSLKGILQPQSVGGFNVSKISSNIDDGCV